MKVLRLNEDIISDLPESVIDAILAHLPIRDAVRTRILSSRWIYKWATTPKLVFDETYKGLTLHNLMSTILKVLSFHRGPISEFTLATGEVESCTEIDQSILYLPRNSMEKFTLNISKGGHYELPSSFFSFHHLTHLDFDNCVFKPPPTFKGFPRLISLVFWEVDIAAEVLEGFISSCPLLESLIIESSKIIRHKIFHRYKTNAPRIKCLASCYAFEENLGEEGFEARNSYFIELFDILSTSIEQLTMGRDFFKLLTADSIPKKLPTLLHHLRALVLVELSFRNLNEISFALCLIRSSPNLKTIHFHLEMFHDGNTIYFPSEEYMDISLDKLVKVIIDQFTGVQSEMDFVKFLLGKSPMLEEVRIKPDPRYASDKFQKQLLTELVRFRRASSLAEIVFEDPIPALPSQ